METTVVTAFFDIGRSDFKAIPRESKQYIEYFKFWGRLKNNLIVYTSQEFSSEIASIRTSFGLQQKTKIIVIDQIESLLPDVYKKMVLCSSSPYFVDFRILKNATSNQAKYSYLMLLKAWFLNDAKKYVNNQSLLAWIDFGYNHGTDLYCDPNDFAFEWNPKVSDDKITVFALHDYDGKPIFEIVRTLEDYMIGTVILCPQKYTSTLLNSYLDSMKSLNDLGLIDDDQLILLMCTQKNPKIFTVITCDWNMQFVILGGKSFKIKKPKKAQWLHLVSSKIKKYHKMHSLIRRSNKLNSQKIRKLYQ